MKGLLLKDFYVMTKYLRIYMLLFPLFVFLNSWGSVNFQFLFFGMIILFASTTSLLSYDERFHWDTYCDAMPISRATVVLEKYLFHLLIVAAAIAATVIMHELLPQRDTVTWQTFVTMGLLVGLIMPAFLFPAIFALGSEKGRVGYYVVVMLSAFISSFFSALVHDDSNLYGLVSLFILLIPIALYISSFFLSVFLYSRREL